MDNTSNEGAAHYNPWVMLWFHPRATVRYLLQVKTAQDAQGFWMNYTIIWTVVLALLLYGYNQLWSDLILIKLEWVGMILGFSVVSISYFYIGSYIWWRMSRSFGSNIEKRTTANWRKKHRDVHFAS